MNYTGGRLTWFGITAKPGNAADRSDPFHPEIQSLDASAFFGRALDAAPARISLLPQAQRVGGKLVVRLNELMARDLALVFRTILLLRVQWRGARVDKTPSPAQRK